MDLSSLQLPQFLMSKEVVGNILSTLILLAAVYGVRFFLFRLIRQAKVIPPEQRRIWIVKTRSILWSVFLLLALVVWSSELETIAVSLVAFSLALVIALKEMLVNIAGYLIRASTQPFTIGDRIEINGIRGDVIDNNLFFTQVMEIGSANITNQYTGRSVNIPNSMFLTSSIINESFTQDFTLHVFRVPVRISKDLLQLREQLFKISLNHVSIYLHEARHAFAKFGRDHGLEPPPLEPRLHIHYVDATTAELVVRIPAPSQRKGRIEQQIISEFTEKLVNRLEEKNP